MFFKKKCQNCGARNDKERTVCIECGAPFGLKKIEDEVSLESTEQLEQVKEKTEEETVPDTLQDETQSTEEIETPEFIKDETSLIEEEANVLPEKLRKLWVKANGRCQCLRVTHGHGIPCGRKLRPDGSDWVCCDLYSFPGMPKHFGIFEIKEDAIICLECYDWKLDKEIDWGKTQY